MSQSREYSNIHASKEAKAKVNDLKRLFKVSEIDIADKIVDFYIKGNQKEIAEKINTYFENLRR